MEKIIEEKKKLFTELMLNNMDEKINKMAFSQEDLDELYSNGEEEIYICAENLHIPLKERKVYYFGINKPTVCIDSKELVDFDSLGIYFQDCYFDEEYSKLIFAEEEKEDIYDIIDDDLIRAEVEDFYVLMEEVFEDYREEMENITIEQYDEYFDFDELDSSDYNSEEYDYETKTKAKLACKEAITEMLDDVISELVSAAEEYLGDSRDYFYDLKSSYEEFISDLSDAYDSDASSYCSEETQRYLMSKKKELFEDVKTNYDYSQIPENEIEKIIRKDIKQRFVLRELVSWCEYYYDDECYCYDLDRVCSYINSELLYYTAELQEELPKKVYGTYMAMIKWDLDRLEKKFSDVLA